MLFNSYEFIFLFLPVTLAGYFLLGDRLRNKAANAWLVIASLFFYGWWDVRYLPLLMGSIAGNYILSGFLLQARAQGKQRRQQVIFWIGVLANLGLLGYYKYLDFFLKNLNAIGLEMELLHLILPLGISFFTITQVLYLLDCHSGVVKEHEPVDYALFVSFFPHLLAGPILFHRQMMTQFQDPVLHRVNWENLSRGMTLFIIGLTKKVVIADAFILYVNPAYADVTEITMIQGWLVAISYMFQLYFDFSGYSDMAVGLALMMNFRIPINFNSPYRATSVINFWQRWHISLTNAITACVYFPLLKCFRRQNFTATVIASSLALFIVGIWHGAGWHYVFFALLQAAGITVNHLWKHYHLTLPRWLAHVLTLLFLAVSLVFFRAGSLTDAFCMLQAMAGFQGIGYPNIIVNWAALHGLQLPLQHILASFPKKIFLLALLLIVFCPNSNQLVKKLQPNAVVLLFLMILFIYTVSQIGGMTDFLYFQF